MIWALIRMELRLLLTERRVRWIAAALLVMTTVAFGIALNEANPTSAEAHRISRLELQRWLDQDPKNPHSAAHYGIWVFKPASPLATLDPGQKLEHDLSADRHGWLQVLRGAVDFSGEQLSAGDGAAISGVDRLKIVAGGSAEVMLFDLA